VATRIRVPGHEDPLSPGPTDLAWEVSRVARGEIGHGEIGGNNRGNHVERFRRGSGAGIVDAVIRGRGPWCAAFASFCVVEAARRLGMGRPPFRTSLGAKKLGQNAARYGDRIPPTEIPWVGDLAIWDRGALLADGSMSEAGHVGIVFESSEHDRNFRTIDGNRGRPPSPVDEFGPFPVGAPRLLFFARY